MLSSLVALIRDLFCKIFPCRKTAPPRQQILPEATLQRGQNNPLISPSLEHDWEKGGTFNPAAWRDEATGNIHLVYRAIGADGISRFAYAYSEGGVSFSRFPYPIFFMESPRLLQRRDAAAPGKHYDPVMYPSGGSWGGCEDPRMVLIDDRFYLTFSAFDGWDFIRVALVTISKEDFLAQRWKWSKPVFLSPENEIHKNWVIFPEKINNRFAILHSIAPRIQVDYIDDLEDLKRGKVKISSEFVRKEPRDGWDTWPRGVGAPPLRTEEGWLILYHATDKREPHKYKLGAMLLDAENPEKIISRSPQPILTPDVWYENDSKPGIVYVCGAVIADEKLYVYYGGGDRHVCVANMPIKKLLAWLKQYGSVDTDQ